MYSIRNVNIEDVILWKKVFRVKVTDHQNLFQIQGLNLDLNRGQNQDQDLHHREEDVCHLRRDAKDLEVVRVLSKEEVVPDLEVLVIGQGLGVQEVIAEDIVRLQDMEVGVGLPDASHPGFRDGFVHLLVDADLHFLPDVYLRVRTVANLHHHLLHEDVHRFKGKIR